MFYFGNVYKHILTVFIPRKMSDWRICCLCTSRRSVLSAPTSRITPSRKSESGIPFHEQVVN